MLTEEEAKEKWCPFVRSEVAGGGVNRSPTMGVAQAMNGSCLCIASECMAFRWKRDSIIRIGGQEFFIDIEDEDVKREISWWWDGRYVKGSGNVYLHRKIVERAWGSIPHGMFVDHIDGDVRNNRRGNLRIVSKAENAANAASRGGASKYRGVYKNRTRWSAQISKAGVRLCLGSFDTEEEAAEAYDHAAKAIHGEHARLNLGIVTNSGRRGFCGLAGRPGVG